MNEWWPAPYGGAATPDPRTPAPPVDEPDTKSFVKGKLVIHWVHTESWGDLDGGEATGLFVAPLARSCISVAPDALP